MGTGAGGGRLVRKPALLPRTTPPIPPSRAEPSQDGPGRAGAAVGPRRPVPPVEQPQRGLRRAGSAAAAAPRLRRAGPARLLGAPLPVPGLSAAAEPSSAPKGQKPEPGLAMAEANRRGGRGAASCSPGGLSECA